MPHYCEDEVYDTRSWYAIESEVLNLRAGHGSSCAYAAGGDCTCGKWTSNDFDEGDEPWAARPPAPAPPAPVEPVAPWTDDDIPF